MRTGDIRELMVSLDSRLSEVPIIIDYELEVGARSGRSHAYAAYEGLFTSSFYQDVTFKPRRIIQWAQKAKMDESYYFEQVVRHEAAHLSAVLDQQELAKEGKLDWKRRDAEGSWYKPHGGLWKWYGVRYGLDQIRATAVIPGSRTRTGRARAGVVGSHEQRTICTKCFLTHGVNQKECE